MLKHKKTIRVVISLLLFLTAIGDLMVKGFSGAGFWLLIELFLLCLCWSAQDTADHYRNLYHQVCAEAQALVDSIKALQELEKEKNETKKTAE